jgi:hypothetical protein
MTATCEIKWIDRFGNPTPDTNPSIGRVRTKARSEYVAGRIGGPLSFAASPWFHICAEHAKRLCDPGMQIWECEAPADLSPFNKPVAPEPVTREYAPGMNPVDDAEFGMAP